MKISESWLREWVATSVDRQTLAAKLTLAGLEINSLSQVSGEFTGVIVAEVIDTKPHPEAKKLSICVINYGQEQTIQVVCGASNVRPGLKVALATINAKLPGEIIIHETILRGEVSQGMLCSAAELQLAQESSGILELSADAPIGANLRDYLTLNDVVLDIEITTNRADCLSVLGIAREIAALTQTKLLTTNLPPMPMLSIPESQLHIKNKVTEACPLYTGRVLRNINPNALSPIWLVERLRRSGMRSIHPVVDVTNYVMLELGQPMHAFDLSTINGDVCVRFATPTEKLTLLDEQTVNLSEQVLVIADDDTPLAIAGIMGGKASAIQDSSIDLFLESAFFNPVTIASTARQYSLFTESSRRFERGVDPALPLIALERATTLLLDIVGGVAEPILTANSNQAPAEKVIEFMPRKVLQLTGLNVSEHEMQRILEALGMLVKRSESLWYITIPSYRFDINLEVDIVEEIARVYGYDKLPYCNTMVSAQVGTVDAYEEVARSIALCLAARGYHETINYSFVDPVFQKTLYPSIETLKLVNPISMELSQMRAGMWPGLLMAMQYNINRQFSNLKLFEVGVIFAKEAEIISEHPCIAGLLVGEHGAMNWSEPKTNFDFYDIKGDLQAVFSLFKLDVLFEAAEHPALHPGKTASIHLSGRGQIGWCGVLHPRIADELGLTAEVILFELRLAAFLDQPAPQFKTISKYPQIRRDLSFLVAQEVSAAAIEQTVRATITDEITLKSFDVFDVYMGSGIPQGKKSIAIAVTLQKAQATMVDLEINNMMDVIIQKLRAEFSIVLRE